VLILVYVFPVIGFHLSSLEVTLNFKEEIFCLFKTFETGPEPQHNADGKSDF